MSVLSPVEEIARRPVQRLTQPLDDVKEKDPRPFRNVANAPSGFGVQAQTLQRPGEPEQKSVFENIFKPNDGFDSLGQEIKEIIFPGTTQTKQGKQSRSDIKKIGEFIESEQGRKVGLTIAKGLEAVGIATGQVEISAAGVALEGLLDFTGKAIPIAKDLASAVLDKDLKKVFGAIRGSNALLSEILEEEIIDDGILSKIEVVSGKIQLGIDKLNTVAGAEHNDRLVATELVIQNENNIAANQTFIEQEELRAVVSEKDEIEEIKNILAPPANTSDMFEELVRFDRGDEMIRFIDDNLELFLGLSEEEQLAILDTMLDSGLVDNLIQVF